MEEEKENEEEDLYYVIENSKKYSDMWLAKYNNETKQFYDYIYLPTTTNNKEFQVGELVRFHRLLAEKADGYVNEEVVEIVKENKLFYKELREKYKDYPRSELDSESIDHGPYGCDNWQSIPSIEEIIVKYGNDRIENGLPVDLYVLDVVRIVSLAMGLRIVWNKGGNLYKQLSDFKYPEELYEVVDLMYDIFSSRFENGESFIFDLYEYGSKGKEFEEFIKELESKTRYPAYYFRSDLEDQIRNEKYHGENFGFSRRYFELSIQKPTIYFTPEETTYTFDKASENARKIITAPEIAIEYYEKRIIKPEVKSK